MVRESFSENAGINQDVKIKTLNDFPEKKMTDEQVASAITGMKIEEIRSRMNEKDAVHKKFVDFLKELKKSAKSDNDFIVTLTSFIATMLYPLPREIRLDILLLLTLHEEENATDKIKDLIKKFTG